VDAHHIEHWADGGETKLSNLVTLCRLHHRLVHEGEILVETLPEGGWRFVHPDGRHFEVIRCARVSPDDWHDYGVEPNAAATRWRGERMDYELGVWMLCNQVIRARSAADTLARAPHDPAANSRDDVAAETSPESHPEHADRVAAAMPPIVDEAGDRWWKDRRDTWGG
jgi:HNH endonuclease